MGERPPLAAAPSHLRLPLLLQLLALLGLVALPLLQEALGVGGGVNVVVPAPNGCT